MFPCNNLNREDVKMPNENTNEFLYQENFSLGHGVLMIFPLQRKILKETKEVILTAKEFDILYFLASYPGVVFTHQQIYEAVWKDEYFCDEGNVTAHIGHIRKKIENDPKNPTYIQTVRGVGYKFAKE